MITGIAKLSPANPFVAAAIVFSQRVAVEGGKPSRIAGLHNVATEPTASLAQAAATARTLAARLKGSSPVIYTLNSVAAQRGGLTPMRIRFTSGPEARVGTVYRCLLKDAARL